MNTSWNGIKFIARREALVRVAYHDGNNKDGSPKFSIGFGSQTPIVRPGDTITTEEAFARMIAHIESNDSDIRHRLKVAVMQQEWDAIASLYYQGGYKPLKAVVDRLNEKNSSIWGILEFANWHFNSDGLAKRRAHEMAMASEGYYGNVETYFYYEGDPRTTNKQEVLFPAQPIEGVT